ncbi:type II secretion system protein GspD [Paraburkholderia sp. D1E]|uniref:type II secretion system protein GspD n=1 Tax=Paraburkholderia sp. D1E TaxID=3461398 RepID=UPI0040458D82
MKRLAWCLLFVVFDVFAASSSVGVAGVPPLPPGMVVPVVSDGDAQPAAPLRALPKMTGSRIDLRFVPVAQVVDLIYADLLDAPYVIDPAVLADTRSVSFRFDRSQGDVRSFLATFLDSLGYQVQSRDGVDYVSKAKESRDEANRVTFVYQPRHRHADYLARLVQPLFSGRVASDRAVPAADGEKVASAVPATSAAGQIDQSVDQLVFIGTAPEVERLKKVLVELDTDPGEVVVRGWAYEVDDTDTTNSGFSLAVKALGGSISVGSGATSADPNPFQLSIARLDVAISALSADSRFHEVSSPHVRCVSGQTVKLNVGQQVPTESSVSYQGTSGTPVQSIAYQDAGVIFNVTPVVMRDTIELNVDEELSSFANTTTGVNSSPTKNTRSLQTVADMKDGEVIVLGGLIQDQSTVANSGERFLPAFLDGHTKSKARTEVVLVLQVQKI